MCGIRGIGREENQIMYRSIRRKESRSRLTIMPRPVGPARNRPRRLRGVELRRAGHGRRYRLDIWAVFYNLMLLCFNRVIIEWSS